LKDEVLPLLLTYIDGRKHFIFQYNLLFWGSSIISTFICDGPIKLVHCKKKKSWTWEAPPNNKYHGFISGVLALVANPTIVLGIKVSCNQWEGSTCT
jgi:hypothetical protein